MTLLVPSSSNPIHEPLPSLPPSPSEEDLGGASPWLDVDDDDEALNGYALGNGSIKGKERARDISLDDDDSEGDLTPTLDGGYPPQKEEEEESRKIEENLKRLEESERNKRKAARDSAAAVPHNNVVSDVTRRASVLLSTHLRRSGSGGSRPAPHHVHSQLGQSSDDALPLSDLHSSPNTLISPAGSKPSSPTSRSAAAFHAPTIAENPFDPPDSATPLRSFDEEGTQMSFSAVMRPSSPPPPTSAGERAFEASPFDEQTTGRPTLQATSSFSRPQPAPPPLPLDLPPPKTPPPRPNTPGGSPLVSSPPKLISAPSTSPHVGVGSTTNEADVEPEHRWWTDWLCGCREEKDRDNAGRTNPFE